MKEVGFLCGFVVWFEVDGREGFARFESLSTVTCGLWCLALYLKGWFLDAVRGFLKYYCQVAVRMACVGGVNVGLALAMGIECSMKVISMFERAPTHMLLLRWVADKRGREIAYYMRLSDERREAEWRESIMTSQQSMDAGWLLWIRTYLTGRGCNGCHGYRIRWLILFYYALVLARCLSFYLCQSPRFVALRLFISRFPLVKVGRRVSWW